MRHFRVVAVCLVGAFALSALTVASAAAAPEFGRCLAKAGGKFLNSGCTKPSTPGKEKFEWLPGAVKNKFHTVLSAGVPTLETVGGTKITCKAEESPGEFKSNNTEVAGVMAKFGGCEASGVKCNSVGAGEGEIVTAALEGKLGVEKKGTKSPENDKLAVELHAPAAQNVAEFACAGLPVVVHGSVLHPVPTNKMLLTATEKLSAAKGEQKPDKFAGGPPDEHTLESNTGGGPFEEAGQTIVTKVTGEEKLEASSVN